MIAKVLSAIPDGYDGHIVEVEGDISNSLPTLSIVGMASKTVSEARERIRSAIQNSKLIFPAKKVTINLAPAELIKNGSHLDLAMALSILVLSRQLLQSSLENRLFVGELSLDGFTRPIRGIINIIEVARKNNFEEVFVPIENLRQARLIPGIKAVGVTSLSELVLHLTGVKLISNPPETTSPSEQPRTSAASPKSPQSVKGQSITASNPSQSTTPEPSPTLADLQGQEFAKRALIIALAGHHNILLSGPPGSGKTLLARIAANLLPPPTIEEQIAITKLHSLSAPIDGIITERPFRAPHHTASLAAIVGGGPTASPGEISLAHHGILFLDEFPEFPRPVIEALRQPLEDHVVSVVRVNSRATYPADFMLIATMNPCPCGYHGDPTHTCSCTTNQIRLYREHISGPILDRIDIIIHVAPVKHSTLLAPEPSQTSQKDQKSRQKSPQSTSKTTPQPLSEHAIVKNTITECRKIQTARYDKPGFYNSSLSTQDINHFAHLSTSAKTFLDTAADRLHLSARTYFKTIRVARTIADLDHSDLITPNHISEAIALRQRLTP